MGLRSDHDRTGPKEDLVRNSALRTQNLNLKRLLDEASLNSVERDVAERLRGVLMGELHHLVKNMMAIVTAIVRQSLRTAASVADAERAIGSRLMAMSSAHDVLLKVDWTSADLKTVIQYAIETHNTRSGRIAIDGPQIVVASSSILPLTMILNELCTNSTKYGALSVESGRISFTWVFDRTGEIIVFRWIETAGPKISAPGPRSFGSRLIEEALPRQLGGTGCLKFSPGGVEYELMVPMQMLVPAAMP